MEAIICIGISASGKTTYAKSLDSSWVNVNRDDLKFSITGSDGWGDYKYKKSVENTVTFLQNCLVEDAHSLGKNVIISDTNLNPKYRDKWEATLKSLGYDVWFKKFPVSLKTAWKRDSLRNNGVGHQLIYEQWLRYEKQFGDVYTPDITRPKAAVFDIDGTIAQMHNRGPFEWKKVGEDKPRSIVISYLKALHDEGYTIVLLSGRDSVCRDETISWLNQYEIPYGGGLFMRERGSNRPDIEIKKELFLNSVAPYYNVEVVVDDRPCMQRLWYSIGIPNVISVADPLKEF